MRPFRGAVPIALCLLTAVSFCQMGVTSAPAQSQAAQAPAKASDLLHPALSQVNQAIVALNISRWKAPGEVRAVIDDPRRQLGEEVAPDHHELVRPVIGLSALIWVGG